MLAEMADMIVVPLSIENNNQERQLRTMPFGHFQTQGQEGDEG